MLSVLGAAVLAACSDGYLEFPANAAETADFGPNVEVIILDNTNINAFSTPVRGFLPSALAVGGNWTYQVGPGDILSVIVFDHPELTLPAGPQRSAAESGFQIASDGTFIYPYIGSVNAAGRSIGEIRNDVAARLANFIPDPQVEVRVAAFNSQAVVVSGAVAAPNRQPLTAVRLTLIEAINAAGGFTSEADPRVVTLQRGGRLHTIDVQGFLEGGLTQNNPILRNGDVVNVPLRRAEEAYLLGEVSRPDVVDLSREPITLTQAITRRGGLDQPRADARGVLVFRANGDLTRVFVLDTTTPEGLILGTRFVLEPRDIVYILRAPLQRWNDTISRLLPTVQAARTVDTLAN
ncbi:MAG: polysaccharide biosynthesis/export family protein [Loktanella sp.]|nr:polysaccharide biosynthesis/export family protein [Loktanella sp.]